MGVDKPLKTPPAYAVKSVDNALRVAAILQLEGPLTVSEVADRIGCARSTAHRLLQMLVYRDFAVQADDRVYRVGPVLELATYSQSSSSLLRVTALPELRRIVDLLDESANLAVRTGDTVRFIVSVESSQALRVGTREGMVFAAHRTTAGLLLLADVASDELEQLYSPERYAEHRDERPDLHRLNSDLERVRRNGFALNHGRSERGVVAVGVPVHGQDGKVLAGISVSMPSVRYDKERLRHYVATLRTAACALENKILTPQPEPPAAAQP